MGYCVYISGIYIVVLEKERKKSPVLLIILGFYSIIYPYKNFLLLLKKGAFLKGLHQGTKGEFY